MKKTFLKFLVIKIKKLNKFQNINKMKLLKFLMNIQK